MAVEDVVWWIRRLTKVVCKDDTYSTFENEDGPWRADGESYSSLVLLLSLTKLFFDCISRQYAERH